MAGGYLRCWVGRPGAWRGELRQPAVKYTLWGLAERQARSLTQTVPITTRLVQNLVRVVENV